MVGWAKKTWPTTSATRVGPSVPASTNRKTQAIHDPQPATIRTVISPPSPPVFEHSPADPLLEKVLASKAVLPSSSSFQLASSLERSSARNTARGLPGLRGRVAEQVVRHYAGLPTLLGTARASGVAPTELVISPKCNAGQHARGVLPSYAPK